MTSDVLWTGPPDDPHRYRVEAGGGGPTPEPGSGGDGLVYRARRTAGGHGDSAQETALKLLLRVTPAELPGIAVRLEATAALDDPRLMRVEECFVGTALTDSGDAPDDEFDVCWIASEWIDGEHLGIAAEERGVPFILGAAADLADALALLHGIRTADAPSGVVHRDVKSSNVRVRADGTVVLIDYGLLRPVDVDASIVGTPGWLAPEVAEGRPGGKPADIYGVGAIAHHLLTGKPPSADGTGASAARIEQALTDREVPLAADIARHLARTLAIRPEQRPTDLAVWAAELRSLRDGNRPRRRLDRSKAAKVAALVLVAGLLPAAGIMVNDQLRDQDDRVVASPATFPLRPTSTQPRCSDTPTLPITAEGQAVAAEFAELRDQCAGVVEDLVDAVILHLTTPDGQPDGVLIASPGVAPLRLTDALFASYREIAGKSQPTNAVTYGGYPVAVRTNSEPDVTMIELSRGGLVIGRRDDTQGFWVPQQARNLWETRGGLSGDLGPPTSNVFFNGVSLSLEFERGYLEAVVQGSETAQAFWLPIDASDVRVVLVDDPAALLATFGDVRNRVLRQASGSSWWVDDRNVRHWIPDGGTWECLTAGGRLVEADVPGPAVASLELGPPATCDDAAAAGPVATSPAAPSGR